MRGTRSLLAALAAGLTSGVLLRYTGQSALGEMVRPAGALWLSSLKMTLVPLIFAMVAGGARALVDGPLGGRVAARVLLSFAAMMVFAEMLGASLSDALLEIWPVPAGALGGLKLSAGHAVALPSLRNSLIAIIPANPVAAAATGEMTSLVVFALLFGIALTRIAPARRDALATLIDAIGETMITIVQGVLWFAPVGIFALALGVALESGIAMMAALTQYVVLSCVVGTAATACCYPVALVFGGIDLRRFARSIAHPQAIAAATTSSMATLPAMIEAAEGDLAIDPALAGAVLPLAVSTFRYGNLACGTASLTFAAHLVGLHPSIGTIVTTGVVLLLSNLGGVGLPAAAILYAIMAPAYEALGVPLELIPLFIAVYSLPDIFDTVANVTGDLTVTTVIYRLTRRRGDTETFEKPAPVSA